MDVSEAGCDVRDLRDAAAKAGGVEVKTLATEDTWAQDFVEFGYVPGPGGRTRTIEVAIRSGQPGRVGGRASQGLQDPLKLDTSWLFIAHVDEFVQFLPADNARGWTIAVADPRADVDLLRTTQAAGHGAVRASSHPDGPNVTVAQLLADG